MFERYTERARRVLFFARYEATLGGSGAIGTEHLLLGLIRERNGITSRIFARAHLSLELIRITLQHRAGFSEAARTGTASQSHPEIPFSTDTKRALQFGAEEADRLEHAEIGAEHLLLGILRVESSVAAVVLTDAGLNLDKVRRDVAELRTSEARIPQSPGVRITPTLRSFEQGTSGKSDMQRWTLEGFHLKPLLSQTYGILETRIELPADLEDTQRYDGSVVLKPSERFEAMHRLMQEGIEKHFQIAVTRETRRTDVYVLTAAKGGITAIKQSDHAGGALWAESTAVEESAEDESRGDEERRQAAIERFKARVNARVTGSMKELPPIQTMAGSGGMDHLCSMLERHVDRPVIDETALTGSYRFEVQSDARTIDEFLRALQDQLGLVVTPAERDVTILVVRHR